MKKTSILFVHKLIYDYRLSFYEQLASYPEYDVTVLHSGNSIKRPESNFREIIVSENFFTRSNLTLKDLLDILINKYGELFKNKLFDIDTGNLKLIILVNGRAADDLNSNIKEDDKINIISSLRGG